MKTHLGPILDGPFVADQVVDPKVHTAARMQDFRRSQNLPPVNRLPLHPLGG